MAITSKSTQIGASGDQVGHAEGTDPNAARFESVEFVESYNALGGLSRAEALLFDRWIPPAARTLDLGVGSGRTYPELRARSSDYIGIDLATAMVDAAQANFPDGRFEEGDAADLSRFGDASFDAVVFSYNGLDYLHPNDRRQAALKEIHRVLRPGGTLVLSSHNASALLRRPQSRPPGLRASLRALLVAAVGTARTAATMLPTRTLWNGHGYTRDRVQGLLTHYSDRSHLVAEVGRAGFEVTDIVAGDHPRSMRRLITPWFYIAAVRAPDKGPLIEVLHDSAAIASIADDWDRLARLDGTCAFQSRPWCEAWHRHLESTATLSVVVARDPGSGRVVGLLPLASLSRRLHHRIPINLPYLGQAGAGVGAADHMGPLAETPSVGAAILRSLPQLFSRRTVLLEHLAPRWTGAAVAGLDGLVVRSTPTSISVRTPDEPFSASWSRKTRKNIRRRRRMLDELQVRARWVAAGPSFDTALRELRRVHLQRWGARGDSGLFDGCREAFLSDVAARCTPPNAPWILLLERNGDVVAGLLGFRHGSTFSVYKTGWDPDLAQLGLGVALGAEAMAWAEDQGLVEFDYLRGTGAHKATLGCDTVRDHSVLRPYGIRGHLLHLRERLSSDRAGGAASR